MRILIIEDEQPALKRFIKLVMEVEPEVQILGTADSIESAVLLMKQHADADLAFMDIELADGQSFEIFKQIEVPFPVIFTTAYDDFAIRAFKLNSIDYLLKPIDKEALIAAISKFKKHHQQGSVISEKWTELMNHISTPTIYKTRFLIKNGTKLVSVSIEDIAFFQAIDKVVYICLKNGVRYLVDFSLDELIKSLDPTLFFQLNRQFIAHYGSVKQIHTWFNGKLKVLLKPEASEEAIVSRDKAPEFKKWMGD